MVIHEYFYSSGWGAVALLVFIRVATLLWEVGNFTFHALLYYS